MSGLPWFRMYCDFLNDPKMISLAFEDQRHFIGVLALKSAGILDQDCNSELLDRIVAQRLWIDHSIIRDVKRRLIASVLIDNDWQPLAWNKRQAASDSSAERVKRYRQKRSDAGLPQQWQPTKSLRKRIYDLDGNKCVYCASTNDLTLDHYISPLNGGDLTSENNLVTACRACNAKKRDFTPEQAGLKVINSKAYNRVTTCNRYSNGTEVEIEVEVDKKNHMSANAEGNQPKSLACPVSRIVELYHSCMPNNPKCKVLDQKRTTAIRARWKQASVLTCSPFGYSTVSDGLEAWKKFFEVCAESKFLTGQSQPQSGKPPFIADIDFLFSPSGFAKCLENKYHRDAA